MPLPAHIKALLEPKAYPEAPQSIELIQTHISYILLTPQFVYKIKKPVDFGFLDFTTLEKRKRFCEAEIRLNRRLTKGIYLKVVPIVATDDGGFRLLENEWAGEGAEPIDYAVMMLRFDEDTTLRALILKDRADEGLIRRIARRIAAFHREAETNDHISEFGALKIIEKNILENFSQTVEFIGPILSKIKFDLIKEFSVGFLKNNAGLFARRVENGFIKDCHGDIHSEHVSVTENIDIIDCIEFNERFRFSDVLSDLAFLSMDLDFFSRGDLSRALEEEYFKKSPDKDGEDGKALIRFYKAYRAYVRGKVECFKLLENEVTARNRLEAKLEAMRHFHLAGLYAEGGFRPMLTVVSGLPGTGKSTLARLLHKETNSSVISSDIVRKELHNIDPLSDRKAAFEKGIYSKAGTEKTYAALQSLAEKLLQSGRSVILDATFSKLYFRKAALETANKTNAEFHIIECTLNQDEVRARLEKRSQTKDVSDADYEIYLKQKERFEPIEEKHIKIDTQDKEETILEAIYNQIFR